jgi:hypothetical protein
MVTLHNRFGEKGQRLTILSLLGEQPRQGAMPLSEAIDELYRIGGPEGTARIVVELHVEGEDRADCTVEENVSLKALAQTFYEAFGESGDAQATLHVLDADEDPLPDGTDVGRSRPHPIEAIRRFREAVSRLFGGSADEGQPPTVLSLLVGRPLEDDEDVPPA